MGSLVNDAWKDAVMRTALDANKKFSNAIKQVPNAASCFTDNQQFKNALNKALSGQSMSSAETRAIFTTILYDCNAFYALAKEVNRLGMKSIWVGGGGTVAAGFGAGRSIAFGISLTDIVNKKSLINAARIVACSGGSTNAALHLPALANEIGIDFDIMDVAKIFKETPYIADLKPGGKYLAKDLHDIGGVPIIMKALLDGGFLDGSCLTVTGKTLKENGLIEVGKIMDVSSYLIVNRNFSKSRPEKIKTIIVDGIH